MDKVYQRKHHQSVTDLWSPQARRTGCAELQILYVLAPLLY